MKKVFFLIVSSFVGLTAFAQKYDFNKDAVGEKVLPANITIPSESNAAAGVVLFTGRDGSASNVFKPASTRGTGVVELELFPSLSDYSITWKQTYSKANGKKGFLLRGNGSCSYAPGLKQGYLFIVYENLKSGKTELKPYIATETGLTAKPAATLPSVELDAPCWYRISAAGETMKFEYSTDNKNWVVATTFTDAEYKNGNSQLVWGLNSYNNNFTIDDILLNRIKK